MPRSTRQRAAFINNSLDSLSGRTDLSAAAFNNALFRLAGFAFETGVCGNEPKKLPEHDAKTRAIIEAAAAEVDGESDSFVAEWIACALVTEAGFDEAAAAAAADRWLKN